MGEQRWKASARYTFSITRKTYNSTEAPPTTTSTPPSSSPLFTLTLRTPTLFLTLPFSFIPSLIYLSHSSSHATSQTPPIIFNILTLSLAHTALTTLKLDRFMTGMVLLSGLFLYDVFWVFGSERVVGSNVVSCPFPISPNTLVIDKCLNDDLDGHRRNVCRCTDQNPLSKVQVSLLGQLAGVRPPRWGRYHRPGALVRVVPTVRLVRPSFLALSFCSDPGCIFTPKGPALRSQRSTHSSHKDNTDCPHSTNRSSPPRSSRTSSGSARRLVRCIGSRPPSRLCYISGMSSYSPSPHLSLSYVLFTCSDYSSSLPFLCGMWRSDATAQRVSSPRSLLRTSRAPGRRCGRGLMRAFKVRQRTRRGTMAQEMWGRMDTQRGKGLRGSYTYGRNGFWPLWHDDILCSSLVQVYSKRKGFWESVPRSSGGCITNIK